MPIAETVRATVTAADCDQLGHMNVGRYFGICGDGVFALQARAGLDPDDIASGRRLSFAVVNAVGDFRSEVHEGEALRLETGVLRVGGKSAMFLHRLHAGDGAGRLVFEGRFTSALMDLVSRRAGPIPGDLRKALERFGVDETGQERTAP